MRCPKVYRATNLVGYNERQEERNLHKGGDSVKCYRRIEGDIGKEKVHITMIHGTGDHWQSLEIILVTFWVTYQINCGGDGNRYLL